MNDQISREIARRSEIIMLYENCSFMEAMTRLLKKNLDLLEEFVKEITGE